MEVPPPQIDRDEENQLQRNLSLERFETASRSQPIDADRKKIKIISVEKPLHKKIHFHSLWIGGIVILVSIPIFGGIEGIGLGIGAITNLFSIMGFFTK